MKHLPVLITGYINPDLDAYACAAAYAELWRRRGRIAQAACYGTPLSEVEYVTSLIDAPILPHPLATEYPSYIIVDTSDNAHLPSDLDVNKVEEVVDHHLYNDPRIFPQAQLDIQAVGAAATLIAERFKTHQQQPSQQTAALLYGAIISNTLNFQAQVTTQRDITAAAWLKPLANLPQTFAFDLFAQKSDVRGEKLWDLLRLDMTGTETDGKIFSVGQLEMVGVPELLATRQTEINHFINHIHQSQDSHLTFISFSDIQLNKTYFLAPDAQAQAILSHTLGLTFTNNTAQYPGLILRKEYMGQVKEFALSI